MEIEKALQLIKSQLKKEVIESKHFKDQCIERELDAEKVKEVAKTNKILGVLEQDENLYKIWFYYEKHNSFMVKGKKRIYPQSTFLGYHIYCFSPYLYILR